MQAKDIPLKVYCDADFRDMGPGSGTARQCHRCETPVHDLSALPRAEARAMLEQSGGHLCVRYLYDVDGRVLFTDAPPRVLPPGWLVRGRRAALIATAVLSPILLEACGPPPVPECPAPSTGTYTGCPLSGQGGQGGAPSDAGGG
jgi:hypothetical protein